MIRAINRWLAVRRLKATMRPDPEYRDKRLAQFNSTRRKRYFDNIRKAGL